MISRLLWNRLRRWSARSRLTVRSLFLHALKPFLSPAPRRPAVIGKILAIRTDRLGDMILTLPAIDALSAAYPDAELQVACRPFLLPLLQDREGIDGVWAIPDHWSIPQLAENIAASAPDMVVDFSAPQELFALASARKAGTPIRVGFAGGGREVYLTDPVRFPEHPIPLTEENRLLALEAGAGAPAPRPVLPVPEMDRRSAENVLRQCGSGPGRMRVAIHPGGYYPSQRLSLGKWAEASRILQTCTPEIGFILLGGPTDLDRVDELAGLIGSGAVPMPPMDLSRLAAILSRCDLLLCNNSGPLHLASAVGTPTVSFSGPTDEIRFHPQGNVQEVLKVPDIPCRPCGRGSCHGHECMKGIQPESIAEAAARILAGTGAGTLLREEGA